MQKFKIVVCENGKSYPISEWKTVPRKGEIVVLADNREFEVTNVLHLLRGGIDNPRGEIMLEVVEKK